MPNLEVEIAPYPDFNRLITNGFEGNEKSIFKTSTVPAGNPVTFVFNSPFLTFTNNLFAQATITWRSGVPAGNEILPGAFFDFNGYRFFASNNPDFILTFPSTQVGSWQATGQAIASILQNHPALKFQYNFDFILQSTSWTIVANCKTTGSTGNVNIQLSVTPQVFDATVTIIDAVNSTQADAYTSYGAWADLYIDVENQNAAFAPGGVYWRSSVTSSRKNPVLRFYQDYIPLNELNVNNAPKDGQFTFDFSGVLKDYLQTTPPFFVPVVKFNSSQRSLVRYYITYGDYYTGYPQWNDIYTYNEGETVLYRPNGQYYKALLPNSGVAPDVGINEWVQLEILTPPTNKFFRYTGQFGLDQSETFNGFTPGDFTPRYWLWATKGSLNQLFQDAQSYNEWEQYTSRLIWPKNINAVGEPTLNLLKPLLLAPNRKVIHPDSIEPVYVYYHRLLGALRELDLGPFGILNLNIDYYLSAVANIVYEDGGVQQFWYDFSSTRVVLKSNASSGPVPTGWLYYTNLCPRSINYTALEVAAGSLISEITWEIREHTTPTNWQDGEVAYRTFTQVLDNSSRCTPVATIHFENSLGGFEAVNSTKWSRSLAVEFTQKIRNRNRENLMQFRGYIKSESNDNELIYSMTIGPVDSAHYEWLQELVKSDNIYLQIPNDQFVGSGGRVYLERGEWESNTLNDLYALTVDLRYTIQTPQA